MENEETKNELLWFCRVPTGRDVVAQVWLVLWRWPKRLL